MRTSGTHRLTTVVMHPTPSVNRRGSSEVSVGDRFRQADGLKMRGCHRWEAPDNDEISRSYPNSIIECHTCGAADTLLAARERLIEFVTAVMHGDTNLLSYLSHTAYYAQYPDTGYCSVLAAAVSFQVQKRTACARKEDKQGRREEQTRSYAAR